MEVDEPHERQRSLGQKGEQKPFHAAVIQGFVIRRSISVGTTTEEENGRMWRVIRDTERFD